MKAIKKYCDKCKKRKHKPIVRFGILRQFPYYLYFGFDLCSKCDKKFIKLVDEFLK